jgi:hypothetical protein
LKGKCCLRYAGNSDAILQRLLVFILFWNLFRPGYYSSQSDGG